MKYLDITSGSFAIKPERIASQYLSVAIHESTNSALLSASSANIIVIVDLKSQTIKQILPLKNPSGISSSPHKDLMAVTSGFGHLQFIDMVRLEWRTDLTVLESFLTGSHLIWMNPVKVAS